MKANKEALDISDEQLSDIMTAKDFNSQAKLILNNEKLMAEWAKIVSETTAVADYAEQARNILIEAENKSLEKQIDNLQSIKDSIGDINKQREKAFNILRSMNHDVELSIEQKRNAINEVNNTVNKSTTGAMKDLFSKEYIKTTFLMIILFFTLGMLIETYISPSLIKFVAKRFC